MPGSDLRKLILRELSIVETDEQLNFEIVGLWSGGSIAIKQSIDTKVAIFIETKETNESVVPKIGQINGLLAWWDELHVNDSSVHGFSIAPADLQNIYPFLSLAEHIFDQISMDLKGPSSLADVEELIESWVDFFTVQRGPNTERVMGLIGELLTFENLAQDSNFESSFWAGPAMGDHDFRSSGCSIEVKVNGKKNGPLTHEISSLNQLDDLVIKGDLYLASYRLQLGSNYQLDTKELIDRVRHSSCLQDAEGRYLLSIALSRAGLENEQIPKKFSTFQIDSAKYFVVDESFPRLTTRDVPSLVVGSSYTVDLSSLSSECDIAEGAFISMETGKVIK